MKQIKIDIFSDPVCPWCYVGKARLERAIEKTENISFDIFWQPFQLNPDMPESGMDRNKYLKRKFGGLQSANAAYASLHDSAKQDGLAFNLETIQTMPNSLNAHRIIRWAKNQDCDPHEVVERLFRAFFVEGRDIGTCATLLEIAVKSGMDSVPTRKLLNSKTDIDRIRQQDSEARHLGIYGVPCFIVDGGAFAVSGAQPVSVWLQLFQQL